MMRRVVIVGCVLALSACDRTRPSQDAPAGPSALSVEAAIDTGQSPSPEAVSATASASVDMAATPVKSEGQDGIYTPPSGSPERTALMDALRGQVEGELGGRAEFVVKTLRSNGQWAFAEVEPQWPGGRRINPANTPLYREEPDWPFDGLHTEAIYRKMNGRWQVLHHSIGATDVWWVDHCHTVPRGILTGC
ncbi:hypothetical protein [Brevundimonas sp. GN22]